MRKRTYFTLLKITVGAGLIALLIYLTPLKEVSTHLRSADIRFLLLAVGLYLLGLLASPLRWSMLLSTKGIRIPFGRLTSYFFIGVFFNNFLPTIVGGDVARASYVGMESNKKPEAFASTIVDRAIGFLALTVIVLSVTLCFSHLVLVRNAVLIYVLIIFFFTGSVFFLFKESIFNKLVHLLRRIKLFNLGTTLVNVYSSIYFYKKHKTTCLFAFGLSVLLQSAIILSNYFLGRSVGMDIGLVYYFLFIPIIAFMSMIPLSPNAIGIRESGYVLLFTQIGATNSQALSLSFLNLFVVLLFSLIGGLVFLLRKSRFKL